MVACVTEGSYNILFAVAIVVGILFILSTAFYYDKFNKATTNRLTANDAAIAKNMTIVSLVIAILSIVTLFILFFGFQKRMMGVYAQIPHHQK